MSSEVDLLRALDHLPVIGIIRGCSLEHVAAVGSAAAESGIGVMEITLDSPNPIESIRALAEACPGVVVGAGTVRTVSDVHLAVEAGASFIVTPILSLPVVEAAVSLGIPIVPGAASPTEIWAAVAAGATAVKVFPARELGGPAYLAAIREPLGTPALIPTGGVGPGDARAYLEAGAIAVGIGGSVFPASALAAGDAATVGSLAADLVRMLR